jgi:cytochrome b
MADREDISLTTTRTSNAVRAVRVWDLPTRLFHWLAVALVAAAYATWRLDWMAWHLWIGEGLLALVLFRVLWGLFGSETARFSSFVASPVEAARHLESLPRREPDRQVGHNPLGGWMVLLMLLLMLLETLTGLYVSNDIADEGPLTEITPAPIANAIQAAHAVIWDVLLAAIALHVAAITAYAIIKGQNLVAPMITGSKRLPVDVSAPWLAGSARAIVLLAASLALAALLENWI